MIRFWCIKAGFGPWLRPQLTADNWHPVNKEESLVFSVIPPWYSHALRGPLHPFSLSSIQTFHIFSFFNPFMPSIEHLTFTSGVDLSWTLAQRRRFNSNFSSKTRLVVPAYQL